MINFRLAKKEDASNYAHILNQSWKDTYGEYISKEHIDDEFNIEKLIKNFEKYISNKEFELYMIEYNNEVVGILELGMIEDIYKDNMKEVGEIRTCHIKRDFQNLGIGKKAEDFACMRLKELGYKVCCLWVKRQNLKAIKFHEKNGFCKTKYSCEETVDGAPSFVMEKDLCKGENNMKTLKEVFEDLRKYFEVENALEQGFSNGKYTEVLANFSKNVTAIDVSKDFLEIARENLKDYNNIKLMLMDAEHMSFADKSFDVLLNTSFHEFDLSQDVYSLDLDLKRRILLEMIRVSDTIIFIEPTENAVTNELFKVFNPNENHSDRIKKSNELIERVMKENGYELIEKGLTFNKDEFSSREELEEEMLEWWADIKVPSNIEEKNQMIKEIDNILEDAGMLKELQVTEEIAYRVLRRRK